MHFIDIRGICYIERSVKIVIYFQTLSLFLPDCATCSELPSYHGWVIPGSPCDRGSSSSAPWGPPSQLKALQTWETHYVKLRLFFIDPFHRLQRGDNTLGNKARHRGSTNIISFLLNYIQLIVFGTTILKFRILQAGR